MTLNEDVLKRLDGDAKTYLSVDEIKVVNEGDDINYPLEFLNSVTPSGMPPHALPLKVGAVVMLLRNLNTKKGLCNGTRLIITKMNDHVLQARIVTGKHAGESVLLPRIGLDTMEDSDLPFHMHRRQFPLRLAYAITINKAQGQTLEFVGIFLPEPVFTHGQLYVAFSRGKGFSKIKVKILPGGRQGKLLEGTNKYFTQNVVYKEALKLSDEDRNDQFPVANLFFDDINGADDTAQHVPNIVDSDPFTCDEPNVDEPYLHDQQMLPSTNTGGNMRYAPPPSHNYYSDSDSE